MNNPGRWIFLVVVLCGMAAGVYLWPWNAADSPPPPPLAQPGNAAKHAGEPAPQTHFPVPVAGDSLSLPALDQSDSSMRAALASLVGSKVFEQLFAQRDIVRRIVATVDNLPREKAAQRLLPLRAASGRLLLAGEGGNAVIDPANAARYQPYVAMAESVDTAALVAAYVRNYPLFQQAYRELGYPSDQFNDRLVQVIDHLLAAPDGAAPVKVVQRRVLYEYADPDLEALSAGQKIMIRVGPQNAARLKARLRDFRRQLTGQAPQS